MTLTEFLEARIAEDEAVAELASSHNGGATFAKDNYGCLLVQPARVLAECAAKRRIVEVQARLDAAHVAVGPRRRLRSGHRVAEDALQFVLRCLALPYAEHPDYDEAWRP